MPADQRPRGKYKQFPKINGRLDLEKLKEQYVNGIDYDWTKFCERLGYNPHINRSRWKGEYGYDLTEWKKAWIRNQIGQQDEEHAPKVVEVRKAIFAQRLNLVESWMKRGKYMTTLFDAVMERHGDDYRHDRDNILAIQAGRAQRRFKLGHEELGHMAACAQRIQAIEMTSLLLVAEQSKATEAVTSDSEGDQIPVMEINTLGAAGMTAKQTTELLAQWFDQAEKPKQLPELPKIEIPPTEDTG